MRQVYNSLNMALICLVCWGLVASAPARAPGNSGPSGANSHLSSNSPQFLYMKRLHDRIKDKKVDRDSVVIIKEEQTSGTLIATSFEADGDISGTGWNTSGFNFSTGNKLILNFVIPNPGDSIGIHDTALWIFPDPSQLRNHSISELTLLVVVELAHANKPRREVMKYSWRMDNSCLKLNLTGLSRKVVNNLQKRGLEKTDITVSVEVVAASDPEVTHETLALDSDLQEGCSALHNRNSNAPFLVMKYYDENRLTSVEAMTFSDTEVVTPSPTRQHKRQSESDQLDTNTSSPTVPTTSDSWKGCQVVPLLVNLTKVLGNFIILPKEIYINDCSGSCNTGRNPDTFTLHSRIKEQIKLVEGVNTLQRSDTCCAPSSYEQRDLLIRKENYYSIVSFPEMVVTGCHCL